ncbi:MAG: hypothetical protein AAF416_20725 [Pseudomonadota bacterium]
MTRPSSDDTVTQIEGEGSGASTLLPSSRSPTVDRLRARILAEIAAAGSGFAQVDPRTEPNRAEKLCTQFGLADIVPDMLVLRAAQTDHPSVGLAIDLVSADKVDAALTWRFDAYRATDGRLHWLIVEPSRATALAGRGLAFTLRDRSELIFGDLGLRLSLGRLLAPDPESPWSQGAGDLPLSGSHLPRFDTIQEFLTWYDAVPGKQRLKLVAGQVRFARPYTTGQRRASLSGDTRDPEMAAMLGATHRLRAALTDALHACGVEGRDHRGAFAVLGSGLLVRTGSRDAFAPDLMVVESAALDRVAPEASFVEPLLVA